MMGYAKYMADVWRQISLGQTADDMRNLNVMCHKLPFLEVDVNHVIFENCANLSRVRESHACICQICGTYSFNRMRRAVKEYTHYFMPEIGGAIASVALLIWLLCRPKKRIGSRKGL